MNSIVDEVVEPVVEFLATKARPVADWPLLLVGPMVRRVTSDEAHVFVATSLPATAGLVLYNAFPVDASGARPAPVSTPAPIELNQIGARLFVGLLSAGLPEPSAAGQAISYDVEFTYSPLAEQGLEPRVTHGLRELGLLGVDGARVDAPDPVHQHVPLGYHPGRLPSFLTPPATLAELRIAHASCRKPHGGGEDEPDALPIVDAAMQHAQRLRLPDSQPFIDHAGRSISVPASPPASNQERPHQLLLTGDQIYADDVAPGLLASLTEAGDELIGVREAIPGADAWYDGFLIQPGWRTRFLSLAGLKDLPAKGATDYPQSHLLRFGEWCAMYVFAWSDALWRRNGDGTGFEIPDAAERIFLSELASVTEAVTFFENLPGVQYVPEPYTRWVDGIKLVGKLDGFEKDLTKVWKDTRAPVMDYAATVPYVRRLLANVATYMMFDDHEVTDDWYLNQKVTNGLFGLDQPDAWAREVGPRMLRNGLSAYAIFQHWGNVPDDFGDTSPEGPKTTKGAQLLEKWRPSPTAPLLDAGDDPLAPAQATRAADPLLGIGPAASPIPPRPANWPAPETLASYRDSFPRLRWDYHIDFGTHRLVALDTRTWRAFPPGAEFAWPAATPQADWSDVDHATMAYVEAAAEAWQEAEGRAKAIGELLAASVKAAMAQSLAEVEPHLIAIAGAAGDLVGFAPPDSVEGQLLATDIELFVTQFGAGHPYETREEGLAGAALLLEQVARKPLEPEDAAARRVAGAVARHLEATASGSLLTRLDALRGLIEIAGVGAFDTLAEAFDAREALVAALNLAGPAVQDELEGLVPDGFSEWFFRDGSDQFAAELISNDALEFMVTGPLTGVRATDQPTILLSPAPVFGNELVEAGQRARLIHATLKGLPGAEEWDFEAWNSNLTGLGNFLVAARELRQCVVLSGDVHYANSSVNDVTLPAAAVDTRYVQLTSSSSHNSDGSVRLLGSVDDILWGDDTELRNYQMSNGKVTFGGWAAEAAREWIAENLDPTVVAELLAEHGLKLFNRTFNPLVWLESTVNSTMAWGHEVAWLGWDLARDYQELLDDPKKKVFGEWVFARDVLRKQFLDLYSTYGTDPGYGYQIRRTMLRDRRENRLHLYGARARFHKKGKHTIGFAHVQEVQTVGNANVGLVRFEFENGSLHAVSHELLFYPDRSELDPREPGVLIAPGRLPRPDWLGTLHRAAWWDYNHDLGQRPRPAAS